LIGAKPIFIQVKDNGPEVVSMIIKASLIKCALGLGIQISDAQSEVLSEDIQAQFSYDSIEDINECLKSARRGEFGFGHNSRNTLNMILITEWMAKHLEKKSIAKEKIHSKHKQNNLLKDSTPLVDYEAYKKKLEEDREHKRIHGISEIDKKKKEAMKEFGYSEFKEQYFKSKPNKKLKA
jgi:hypothetical protein